MGDQISFQTFIELLNQKQLIDNPKATEDLQALIDVDVHLGETLNKIRIALLISNNEKVRIEIFPREMARALAIGVYDGKNGAYRELFGSAKELKNLSLNTLLKKILGIPFDLNWLRFYLEGWPPMPILNNSHNQYYLINQEQNIASKNYLIVNNRKERYWIKFQQKATSQFAPIQGVVYIGNQIEFEFDGCGESSCVILKNSSRDLSAKIAVKKIIQTKKIVEDKFRLF